MNSKTKLLSILTLTLFFWVSFLIVVSQAKYPLPGDALLHWREAKEVISEKSLEINNVIYPEAPYVGAKGFLIWPIEVSGITGMPLDRIFLLLPIFIFIFYFLVIYLITNMFVNNKLISIFSSFSFLMFFVVFTRNSLINEYVFAKGSYVAAFLILLFITIFLNYKKKYFVVLLLMSLVIATLHRGVALCFLILLFILFIYVFIKSLHKSERGISYSNQYFALIISAIGVIILLSLFYLPTLMKFIGTPETEVSISKTLAPVAGAKMISISKLNDFFIKPYFNLSQGIEILLFLLFILGLIYSVNNFHKINHKIFLIVLLLAILIGLFLNIKLIYQDFARILFPFYYSFLIGNGIFLIFTSFKHKANIFFALLIALFSLFFFQGMSLFPYQRFDPTQDWNISEGAMSFLSATPKNSLIVADQYTGYFLTTALSKEIIAIYPGHGGSYVDNFYNLTKRRNDIRTIYRSCDINETLKILKEYEDNKSIFIYLGYLENAHYKACKDKFEIYFEKIDFETDKIYYLDNLTFI